MVFSNITAVWIAFRGFFLSDCFCIFTFTPLQASSSGEFCFGSCGLAQHRSSLALQGGPSKACQLYVFRRLTGSFRLRPFFFSLSLSFFSFFRIAASVSLFRGTDKAASTVSRRPWTTRAVIKNPSAILRHDQSLCNNCASRCKELEALALTCLRFAQHVPSLAQACFDMTSLPARALLVQPHWCDEILAGRKTWEIRGSSLGVRGRRCFGGLRHRHLGRRDYFRGCTARWSPRRRWHSTRCARQRDPLHGFTREHEQTWRE